PVARAQARVHRRSPHRGTRDRHGREPPARPRAARRGRSRDDGTTPLALPRPGGYDESALSARLREPRQLHHGAPTVLHDPMPGPLTAIALVVRAGSRYDGAQPGIAHMAEHMLFQGTRRLDQATLNRRAGELGGEHDADTGYEDVTLHFEVFNDDVEE